MYCRPAGMSDSEDSDDGFSFGNDDRDYSNVTVNDMPLNNVQNDQQYDFEQKRIFESRIINACVTGNLETIQNYHEQYDIDQNLYTGWTPLLYATSSVQPELVEYLLNHKADPNKHKDGFTPLMALCNSTMGTSEKSFKCLILLIQAKADVNMINKNRETALMYACKSKDVNFVDELIKHVKNVDACDTDNKTALSYATTANKPDIVKILLKHNADISLTDKYNMSAKDIADTKEFKEISALLTKDEEEESIFCEIFQIRSWKDLFSDLYPRNKKALDYDVSVILEGMGLQEYSILFQQMDLKTFLQLTEDDIQHLGINISVHKKQFLQSLEKFHNRTWHLNSLGRIKKFDPYTIYDGIITLTNTRKQIGIIASSFQYVKNNLVKATNENIHLSVVQKMDYEKELKKMQNTLKSLKNEIVHIKKLVKKINKESDISVPATFISSKKNSSNWTTITLSIMLIVGLYFYKTTSVQKF